MIPKTKAPVGDEPLSAEYQPRQVCLHKRCKTLKKGFMWQCRICGEKLVKGINDKGQGSP